MPLAHLTGSVVSPPVNTDHDTYFGIRNWESGMDIRNRGEECIEIFVLNSFGHLGILVLLNILHMLGSF